MKAGFTMSLNCEFPLIKLGKYISFDFFELPNINQHCCNWKLNEVGPCDRDMWRSSVRSAVCAASQLPGREPTDVDDAAASAR